jgi:hypothetical protein
MANLLTQRNLSVDLALQAATAALDTARRQRRSACPGMHLSDSSANEGAGTGFFSEDWLMAMSPSVLGQRAWWHRQKLESAARQPSYTLAELCNASFDLRQDAVYQTRSSRRIP